MCQPSVSTFTCTTSLAPHNNPHWRLKGPRPQTQWWGTPVTAREHGLRWATRAQRAVIFSPGLSSASWCEGSAAPYRTVAQTMPASCLFSACSCLCILSQLGCELPGGQGPLLTVTMVSAQHSAGYRGWFVVLQRNQLSCLFSRWLYNQGTL